MHPGFRTRGPKLTHFNSICWSYSGHDFREIPRLYSVGGGSPVRISRRARRLFSDAWVIKPIISTARGLADWWPCVWRGDIWRNILRGDWFLFLSCAGVFAVEFSSSDESITPGAPPPSPGYAEIVRMPWILVRFIDRLFCAPMLPGQSPSETVLGRIFVDSLSRPADWMNGRCVIRVVSGRARPTRTAVLFWTQEMLLKLTYSRKNVHVILRI